MLLKNPVLTASVLQSRLNGGWLRMVVIFAENYKRLLEEVFIL
jgi:hypothetical protein